MDDDLRFLIRSALVNLSKSHPTAAIDASVIEPLRRARRLADRLHLIGRARAPSRADDDGADWKGTEAW